MITFDGTNLNAYIAMLFRGIPAVDKTMATDEFVGVSGLSREQLRQEFRWMPACFERRGVTTRRGCCRRACGKSRAVLGRVGTQDEGSSLGIPSA